MNIYQVLEKLDFFSKTKSYKTSIEDINIFVSEFENAFSQDSFIITNELVESFFIFNPVIAKLFYLVNKNTDNLIKKLSKDNLDKIQTDNKQNAIKILSLYSGFNKVTLDYDYFFEKYEHLVSYWYFQFLNNRLLINKEYISKLETHLNYLNKINNPIAFSKSAITSYFLITYINSKFEKNLKEKLNFFSKSIFGNSNYINSNQINSKKIAVVSNFMNINHSVSKCFFNYFKALSKDYKITLICSGDLQNIDLSIFESIINIDLSSNAQYLNKLINNDFGIIFYPEVGMSIESIILSNIRIAPIQIAGYGHPVSTFGSEIDYFIGGFDVEDLNKIKDNYSENVILMPIRGVYPYIPEKTNSLELNDNTIIGIPHTLQKLNPSYLEVLELINKRSNKKIIFRFFPSLRNKLEYLILEKEIEKYLPKENFEIIKNVETDIYLKLLAECDFAIDCFPFGGHNTVLDCLSQGIPILVLEDEKAYSKFGISILKELNLNTLICTRKNELIIKSLKLIESNNVVNLKENIENLNLENLIEKDISSFRYIFDQIFNINNKLVNSTEKETIIISKINSVITKQEVLFWDIYNKTNLKNELLKLFHLGKTTELCNLILDKLLLFAYKDKNFVLDDAKIFIETFLEIFITDTFIIPKYFQELFIIENNTISLLVKVILKTNTDSYLKILLEQKPYQNDLNSHLSKVLTLYSTKNNIEVDYKTFFDTNQYLASVWYWRVFYNKNYVLEQVANNIKEHINQIENISNNLEFIDRMDHAYFISTYISNKDLIIKRKINDLIKDNFKTLKFNNIPNIKKIAVASAFWYEEHSVYRVLYPFIKSLSEDYEITFIKLGNSHYSDKDNIFSNIKNVSYKHRILNISEIKENDFQVIYYPDIGMSIESIILSNLRIAPIQIAGYGHPVSTFGSEIDFFMVGEDTENIEEIEKNYSEKVIVLPFNGLKTLNIKDIKTKDNSKNKNEIIISCLASIPKLNHEYILMLNKIIKNSKKKVIIRFLCAEAYPILLEEFKIYLIELIGESNIEVYGKLNYEDYLSICSESDLIIDSYPFGGFNTFIDSLYLKKPFFVLESNKAYGKFASSSLKKIGLQDLVCQRSNEFIIKIIKAINNDNYLSQIKYKVENAPINFIFGRSDEIYLKKALEYIIRNNEVINNKKIINILDYKSNTNDLLLEKMDFYFKEKNFLDSTKNYFELKDFFLDFLNNFIKDDFIISENEILSFINMSNNIGFLAKIFNLNNTDSYISKLLNDKPISNINKLTKILTLYSFNNEIEISYEKFFECDKTISSYWYWKSFSFSSYNSEIVANRIKKHCKNFDLIHDKLNLQIDVSQFAYFYITYAYPEYESKIKSKINKLAQNVFHNFNLVSNKANKKKVGIISEFLRPRHAVRRSLYKYIELLADDYDLYLINIGEIKFLPDKNIFKEVIKVEFKNNSLDISNIPKDLYTVYYPDIGMNSISIQLSNIRLAPIQIAGYGHPVSTFGSEIDYFIGGIEVEEIERAKENYSEKLVLLNDMAVTPEYPLYDTTNEITENEEFIISCPWTIQKINYDHLMTVKEIIKKVNKKVKLRFFTGIPKTTLFYYLKIELEELFNGFDIEVLESTNYHDYMNKMNECTISIEPYHFGGYNIVVDSIFLRKPVISFNGNKGYNKFASSLLNKVDLKELIATNKEEYISKTIELINDDFYRKKIIEKIKLIDLEKALFNKNGLESFKRAFQYLIENHDEIKTDKQNRAIVI